MRITVRLLASYRPYLPPEHDAHAGYARHVAPGVTVAETLADLPLPPTEVYTFFVSTAKLTKALSLDHSPAFRAIA